MHVRAQLCLIFCDPIDCSLPGFSVHRIFHARILKQVAISYNRGSFQPRDWIRISWVSCIGRQIPHHWPLGKPIYYVPVTILDSSDK